MRHSKNFAIALGFLAIVSRAYAADGELPWVFNAPAAEGYSITLESVSPAPGTPLMRGSEVPFIANVSYTLNVAKHGMIVLVPQDEKNRSVASGGAQVMQEVTNEAGKATLQQTLVIPRNAKEVRLFIPIVPDGITKTTGEITIRYPIVKKLK